VICYDWGMTSESRPGPLAGIAFALALVAAVASIAIASSIVIVGSDRVLSATVLDVAVADVVRIFLIAATVVGGLLIVAPPSSGVGRAVAALFALAVGAPWLVGVVRGTDVQGILSGSGMFYESWPALAQPALIGAVVGLLVLLLTGLALLGGKRRGVNRSMAVAVMLIPIAGAVVLFAIARATPTPTASPQPVAQADAGIDVEPGAARATDKPPPSVDRRGADPSGEPGRNSDWSKVGQNTYDCSGRVFPERDVTRIEQAFEPSQWRARALELLSARYPDAAWMVGTLKKREHFDAWFQGGTNTWSGVVRALPTAVHEAAHMAGLQNMRGRRHPYVLGKNDRVTLRRTKTFHRADIADDLPSEVRALSYTDIYLSGNSGAQGFEMLLEELNAYTWSLYTEIAFADQRPARVTVSGRDGLLALMYFTEAYLRRAREREPKVYNRITGDKSILSATLTFYDRASCVLRLSDGIDGIGIDDDMLKEHVFGDKALGEVERLR